MPLIIVRMIIQVHCHGDKDHISGGRAGDIKKIIIVKLTEIKKIVFIIVAGKTIIKIDIH